MVDKPPRGFVHDLARFREFADRALTFKPTEATIAVTETYARRKLKIKQGLPLEYKGLQLKCIGSPRWRLENSDSKP